MDLIIDIDSVKDNVNSSFSHTVVNSTNADGSFLNSTVPDDSITSTIWSVVEVNDSLVTEYDSTPTTPFWSDNSTNSNNKMEYLEELSRKTALEQWPVISYIGILMIVGLVGNLLVLYVHLFKFKRSSTRTFVVSLACFDVLSCAIAMPGEILDIRFGFDYPSAVCCKLLRSITSFCSISSGFTLMAVSYDRYRRICNPLKRQMGHKKASMMVFVASAASLFISWPLALLSGYKTVETNNPNITGIECSVSDNYRKSKFPLIYTICLFLAFMSAFVVMTVFYSLIGRQVTKQSAFRKSVTSNRQRNRTISSNISDSDRNGHRIRKISSNSMGGIAIEENQYSFENESDYSISYPSKRTLNRKSSLRSINKITKKMPDDNRTRKITMMLFLISLVFLLSFMPHLILKAIQALNKGFAQSTTLAAVILYNIFVRSFLINSVSNAFIYGFCSPRFRKECKDLFKRIIARRRTFSLNSNSLN
ncbi:cholecystokinin receptor [Patella vulgata]|uniref:cholecystokinin receptor n=1 Tax=Patella vulgata TaxID=6465 RepID=UPI00217FCD5E|nr:cholecystokinin receptor [Patella vulgata]